MTTARSAAVILALTAVLPASTSAQELAPDGTFLSPGVDTLGIYLIRGGDTTEAGFIIDELILGKYANDSVLIRVYTHSSDFGTGIDSFVNTYRALRPLMAHGTSDTGAQQLDFTADRVTGSIWLADGQKVEIDAALPPNIIDSGSFDLALRASELAIGTTLEMEAFVANARAVLALYAHVTAIEEVWGVDCWRVEAVFVGVPVTFWISLEDRSLVRQVLVVRPGLSMLIDSRPPAVMSFPSIFLEALDRHGALDDFEDTMALGEQADPFFLGAELGRRGLARLDDGYLLKHTRLIHAALNHSSEEVCADWIRGRAPRETIVDFFSHLNEEQLRDWADVIAAAVAAGARSNAVPAVVTEADFDAAVETIMFTLDEDVAARLWDVLWTIDVASDSEVCWAGRLLFRTTLQLEPTARAEVVRALANFE